MQAYFEGTFVNARNAAMMRVHGDEGDAVHRPRPLRGHPERHSKLKAQRADPRHGPRGPDFYDQPDGELLHLANWIECIRSRKTPTAPAEAGVQSASAAHLANKCIARGRGGEVGGTRRVQGSGFRAANGVGSRFPTESESSFTAQ